MQTRTNDHHMLLYGEDGQSGFVATTQDFISRQKGAYAVIILLLAVLTFLVAYATFVRDKPVEHYKPAPSHEQSDAY